MVDVAANLRVIMEKIAVASQKAGRVRLLFNTNFVIKKQTSPPKIENYPSYIVPTDIYRSSETRSC